MCSVFASVWTFTAAFITPRLPHPTPRDAQLFCPTRCPRERSSNGTLDFRTFRAIQNRIFHVPSSLAYMPRRANHQGEERKEGKKNTENDAIKKREKDYVIALRFPRYTYLFNET